MLSKIFDLLINEGTSKMKNQFKGQAKEQTYKCNSGMRKVIC